jgi:hypothetical protein
MMVSTAMAVLPVWRSPMISSRCPRPMGIIESMALMPVCIGLVHRLAGDDARGLHLDLAECLLSTGPLPSMGCPSAFTTRPDRRLAHRHLGDLAGALDGVALLDALEAARGARRRRCPLQVQHQAHHALAEVEQLAGHGRLQAVDAGDAVAGLEHGAGLGDGDLLVEALDLLADDLADLFGANLHVVILVLSC